MPDKEKAIEALQYLISGECTDTQFDYLDEIEAAIALLKGEEERYADMVLSWLMEIALNNSDAREEMLYIDAIMDIHNRAKTGLKQYFIDKQKGEC